MSLCCCINCFWKTGRTCWFTFAASPRCLCQWVTERALRTRVGSTMSQAVQRLDGPHGLLLFCILRVPVLASPRFRVFNEDRLPTSVQWEQLSVPTRLLTSSGEPDRYSKSDFTVLGWCIYLFWKAPCLSLGPVAVLIFLWEAEQLYLFTHDSFMLLLSMLCMVVFLHLCSRYLVYTFNTVI